MESGLGARQVIKAEVLRYFTIEDKKIVPPSVEAEIDLLPQVKGYEGEESPASEGDDDVMEELFGDKRLDEEENQMLLDMEVGAPVGEGFLVNASPVEVPDDFKWGSTQIPATQEEVARGSGDFNIAMHNKWLRNIIGQGVLSREVNRDEVDALIQMGWRLTWKEKTGPNKEENDADKEADETGKRKPKQADSKPNPSEGKKAERTPKARCFIKGFTDKWKVDTYVGTPSIWAILLCFVFALSFGLVWYGGDVKEAFLSAELKNRQRAGVIIPKWIPKAPDLNPYPDISGADYEEIKAVAGAIWPGQIHMVEKGLYRMPCSGNLFNGKMQRVQKSRGFKRVESGVAVQRPNRVEGMPPQPAKALQNIIRAAKQGQLSGHTPKPGPKKGSKRVPAVVGGVKRTKGEKAWEASKQRAADLVSAAAAVSQPPANLQRGDSASDSGTEGLAAGFGMLRLGSTGFSQSPSPSSESSVDAQSSSSEGAAALSSFSGRQRHVRKTDVARASVTRMRWPLIARPVRSRPGFPPKKAIGSPSWLGLLAVIEKGIGAEAYELLRGEFAAASCKLVGVLLPELLLPGPLKSLREYRKKVEKTFPSPIGVLYSQKGNAPPAISYSLLETLQNVLLSPIYSNLIQIALPSSDRAPAENEGGVHDDEGDALPSLMEFEDEEGGEGDMMEGMDGGEESQGERDMEVEGDNRAGMMEGMDGGEESQEKGEMEVEGDDRAGMREEERDWLSDFRLSEEGEREVAEGNLLPRLI
uniref:Uncharacterized protein n=1 Tax=Chromera velia CCMP2878 TaxID=1169474 RepID=A0A0G4GWM2_9ALVE|eukprot:Cvel_23689.t1-p1 / transcript=Cvel_23689.t1 / gene=Cvel_23689 / organism=Chromera_velia_CCMP2878 / gene_product=hypothetical protein / transcript_product=hypothetical protein / location=Cvel_scaffold2471:3244-8454(-) / protein_length=755 / sequence_SO=supercontig / SO=protein_coding / is_pseudo=false